MFLSYGISQLSEVQMSGRDTAVLPTDVRQGHGSAPYSYTSSI
ncbi:hypothetical protein QT971_02900 [Microcoleus sp. herbarium19]